MHNRAAKVETLLKHLVGENLEEHVDGGGEDGGDVGDVHAAQDMWASETVMVAKDFWWSTVLNCVQPPTYHLAIPALVDSPGLHCQ